MPLRDGLARHTVRHAAGRAVDARDEAVAVLARLLVALLILPRETRRLPVLHHDGFPPGEPPLQNNQNLWGGRMHIGSQNVAVVSNPPHCLARLVDTGHLTTPPIL